MKISFINLYYSLPIVIQNIATSIYGFYWRRRRFGGVFDRELQLFRSRNKFSVDNWHEYQEKELRKILISAFINVPFYRKKYSEAGFTINDLKKFTIDDLKKLPYLEKEELRQFGKTDLLSKKRSKGSFFSSSGSTGTPTSIYFSEEFHQKWSAAFEVRIREWAGVNRFSPRGMIGGRKIIKDAHSKPPYYRYNFFEKQTYFSAYHIGPSTVDNYLKGIVDGKVEYMTGYAMSNYLLAKEFEKAGLKPPKMKAVITSSEKLTDEMRETFQKVYGCKVYDSYSGVEACGLISETKIGQLVNSPDVGIIEVLDEKGNMVKEGESGELVSTGLLNFDQPLIRYKIGDRVCLSKNSVSEEGIYMPKIESIDGRIEDVVVGPDGRIMVRFHSIFLELDGLIMSQVIQESINHINLKLVIDDQYKSIESEKLMTNRIKNQLGDLVNVSFEYVNELPLTASGKTKAVISKI
jgi:phenylacetate-CoA ligase